MSHVFSLLLLLIPGYLIAQEPLVQELMEKRKPIYFEELYIYLNENNLKTLPYYPYKGDFISPKKAALLDKAFEKFGGHQNGGQFFYIDLYYVTKTLAALLFRRTLGGSESTIFVAVWDLENKNFEQYIKLGADLSYEGVSNKTISLISDSNQDGILDFLSISLTEQTYIDSAFTSIEYDTYCWEKSASPYFIHQKHQPLIKHSERINLTYSSLEDFLKLVLTETKTENWGIQLGKFNALEAAQLQKETLDSIKREKTPSFIYPFEHTIIRIYTMDSLHYLIMEGFKNQNQADIFLGEVKEYLGKNALVKNLTNHCEEWIYDCSSICHYYCK